MILQLNRKLKHKVYVMWDVIQINLSHGTNIFLFVFFDKHAQKKPYGCCQNVHMGLFTQCKCLFLKQEHLFALMLENGYGVI